MGMNRTVGDELISGMVQAQTRPQGRIDTINDELQKQIECVRLAAGRAGTVADRMFGAEPENIRGGVDQDGPVMSHGVGYTEALMGELHAAITALQFQIDRLEAL